jgi:translation elongation factor EF-1alpha
VQDQRIFSFTIFHVSSSDDLRNRDQRCQENSSYLEALFERIILGEKELDWETISAQDGATVIKKDVKLIEGLNMPQLLGHVDLWKSPKYWNGFAISVRKFVIIVVNVFIFFLYAKCKKC